MNPVATLRHISDGDLRYDGLMFWCPGCERRDEDGSTHAGLHMLPVNSTVKTPQWTWNGSLDSPTLTPSILTRGGNLGPEGICHSYMTDGQMQFLGDCTHHLVNQTVPLPPLPDWAVRESDV